MTKFTAARPCALEDRRGAGKGQGGITYWPPDHRRLGNASDERRHDSVGRYVYGYDAAGDWPFIRGAAVSYTLDTDAAEYVYAGGLALITTVSSGGVSSLSGDTASCHNH